MGTVYFNSDIDFQKLQNLVLREIHEPEGSGSEAVPLELTKDKLNEVYANVFNDQRIRQSAREQNISFVVVPDDSLRTDVAAGAVTIPLNNSANFRSSGAILLQNEIVTYTGNDTLNNELTGVSATKVPHYGGEAVRQLYTLSTEASSIDDTNVQLVTVNGIPYSYQPYERLISSTTYAPFSWTIYKGYLLFTRNVGSVSGGSVGQGFMVYTLLVTPMSANGDKPTFIPNQFRVPLLVYGACMLIAASDSFRTSWDWWEKQYDKALSQYIAWKNKRVVDRNNKTRPSLNRFNF